MLKALLLDLDNTAYAYAPCHAAGLEAAHALAATYSAGMLSSAGTEMLRPPPNSSRTTTSPSRSRCSSKRRMRPGELVP